LMIRVKSINWKSISLIKWLAADSETFSKRCVINKTYRKAATKGNALFFSLSISCWGWASYQTRSIISVDSNFSRNIL
jgi:hypothetical protein